jgi:ABC-type branched-subunit amino acid transport system substrate-binding protein
MTSLSGCGERWSSEQAASVDARYAGGGVGGSATSGGATRAGSGSAGSTSSGGATAAGGASTGATGGEGGASSDVGGAGSSGAGAAAASLPCAAPSDAPGVTDSTITIGTISSLTGPLPGIGTSALEAVRSYVNYRNSTGGVCGRQLEVQSADDGVDGGRHRAALNELAPRVLAIVGGVGGGDFGSADAATEQNIPVVVPAISEQFQSAPTVFDMNPPFADPNVPYAKYRYLYDAGVRTAAIVYVGVAVGRSEMELNHIPQMQAAGIQIVLRQEFPVSTLSYDSLARAVANSGADYMLFLYDYQSSAAMARALDDVGYELDFAEYTTAYATQFPELAGSAAEGATTWIRSLPNEDAGSNPELAAFLEWMDQTAPDANPDLFAADSWASANAFVGALEAIPGPITREALMAQLRTMNEFDAGGMYGRIQLGNKVSNGCQIGLRYTGGAWTRIAPSSGFLC